MAASEDSDYKILLFNNDANPLNRIFALLKKCTPKTTSLIKKRLVGKVKCLKKYIKLILIWQRSNVGGNQMVNGFFSPRISWNKMLIRSTSVRTQRT